MDHTQIICTSLQTDNHASTPLLNFFYRPDTFPDAQLTASKHWKHMSKLIISFIFRNFFLFFAWVSWLVLPPENMYKWQIYYRRFAGWMPFLSVSKQWKNGPLVLSFLDHHRTINGRNIAVSVPAIWHRYPFIHISWKCEFSWVPLSLACCDGWWQWNMNMLCPACKLWCKTVVQCKRSSDVYAVLTVLQWLQSVTCWRCLRVHSLSSCSIPCSLNTAFFWSVQIVLARCWLSVFTVTILLNWCMCFAVVAVMLDFVILDGYVEDEEYWLHCRWWSTWLVVILVTLQVMEYLIGCGIGYIAGDGVPDWLWYWLHCRWWSTW